MNDVNWRAKPYAGYHRRSTASEDAELTHTGPGTPCGEYMRRFWQPVAMAAQVKDLPLLIRVLGEELALFRDLSGRYGLLHKHCSHRRASLEYGIVAASFPTRALFDARRLALSTRHEYYFEK